MYWYCNKLIKVLFFIKKSRKSIYRAILLTVAGRAWSNLHSLSSTYLLPINTLPLYLFIKWCHKFRGWSQLVHVPYNLKCAKKSIVYSCKWIHCVVVLKKWDFSGWNYRYILHLTSCIGGHTNVHMLQKRLQWSFDLKKCVHLVFFLFCFYQDGDIKMN